LVMLKLRVSAQEAKKKLRETKGDLRETLGE
jgi:NACalpha-BTF3-like transcription factor